ncbi:MAG TPA: hypothetical protein VJB02_05720, partial [Coxiellaceae bacterium]|nr:hypothetical protein [Coxiellaceae bacterium]
GLDSPVPAHNMLYNPPWEILLGEQTPVITVRKPISAITPLTSTVITPPFRIRSKHHSRFFLEYKGWEKVSRWQPARFSKGIIYVAKTCPLVFETAVHLARQGYKLMPLPLTFPKSEVAGEMNLSVIKEVINKFFQHSIWSCYTTVLMKWGWEDIAKAVKTYYSDSHYYLDFFSKTSRVKAVLCNYPSSALAHACYQHSISLVGFQHGHASEISGWDHYFDIIKEPNRCDIFISFTQLAKETLSRKKMRVSKIFSVGVPHDYFASSYRRRTDNTIDILFVSKNIPMKYDAYPNSGMHDVQKTQLEYELVRNVFKHLPHSVMVKRYPTGTRGFLDTSVLEEEVSVAHNIEFDQHWYDLRYYFPYCRIVMVASFTSTLGWCVLAGKPLVFIDLPTHSPLLPALRETMEKSVFFFNGESNNFYENFRNFLNQPLSVIEQLWTEKTVEREHMVRQFFTDSHPDSAGKRAAMAIESELQAKKIVQADTVLVEGES